MKIKLRSRDGNTTTERKLDGVTEIPHVVLWGHGVYVHEAGVGDARAAAGEIVPLFIEATRLARVFIP